MLYAKVYSLLSVIIMVQNKVEKNICKKSYMCGKKITLPIQNYHEAMSDILREIKNQILNKLQGEKEFICNVQNIFVIKQYKIRDT